MSKNDSINKNPTEVTSSNVFTATYSQESYYRDIKKKQPKRFANVLHFSLWEFNPSEKKNISLSGASLTIGISPAGKNGNQVTHGPWMQSTQGQSNLEFRKWCMSYLSFKL